eukprot:m.132174 g.132174  ORF g.132174 m.132174 type:complete len:331 (-) comp14803_c1_seq7:298-1290(-)
MASSVEAVSVSMEQCEIEKTPPDILVKAFKNLRNDYAALKSENESLKAQFAGAKGQVQKLVQQLNETNEANFLSVEALQKQVCGLEKTNKALREENEALKNQLAEQSVKLQATEERLTARDTDVKKLMEQLSAFAVNFQAQLSAQAVDFQAQLSTQGEKLQDTQQRLSATEKQLQGIKTVLAVREVMNHFEFLIAYDSGCDYLPNFREYFSQNGDYFQFVRNLRDLRTTAGIPIPVSEDGTLTPEQLQTLWQLKENGNMVAHSVSELSEDDFKRAMAESQYPDAQVLCSKLLKLHEKHKIAFGENPRLRLLTGVAKAHPAANPANPAGQE